MDKRYHIRFLVTPMVSFGHCIICLSIYGFWLPLWYLLAIDTMAKRYQRGNQKSYIEGQIIQWPKDTIGVTSIVLSVLQYTVSGYPYGIFWPLYYLSFNIRFLVTPLVSFGHCIICPSIYEKILKR
jgi:hypothetical protein